MIRIGLLGASRIAPLALIEPAARTAGCTVAAVAARDGMRARAYSLEHGIPVALEGYDALVEYQEVDAVYNALPPSGHLPWSIRALHAGKHVLCEKPFAMNANEAAEMAAAARDAGRVLLEAFHYRFHPLFEEVLSLVRAGAIGRVRRLDARLLVRIRDAGGELRHRAALGGGALMDLGCYPLHWVRTVMGAEPEVLSASRIEGRPGVDLRMQARLGFPDGDDASVLCSMQEELGDEREARLEIDGDTGRLEVFNPLMPQIGHSLVVETADGREERQVPGETTYEHQLRHFLDAIAGRAAPLTGGDDAVANMRLIDAVYRASGMQPRGAPERS